MRCGHLKDTGRAHAALTVRCRGGGHPAFDLPVEPSAAQYVNPQAAVVRLADVRPHRLRIVPFQYWPAELVRPRSGEVQPVLLSGVGVRVLVDVDTENKVIRTYSGHVQEPEKEHDQRGVAVDENHSVDTARWLGLRAFAPVGDCSGDEDFTVADFPDLGGRGRHLTGAAGSADLSLSRPVSVRAFGRALPAF